MLSFYLLCFVSIVLLAVEVCLYFMKNKAIILLSIFHNARDFSVIFLLNEINFLNKNGESINAPLV